MDILLPKILNILIAPPGNLIFHLVLAFSVLASLQAVMITRRSGIYPHSGRLAFGLGMLLAGQMILFLSSGLAWQGVLNPHIFLPPLDRAIFTFSLVWIVWLWCFWKPSRLADVITGLFNLILLLLFLFTYASWSTQASEASFNNHWADLGWELTALIIVLTGMGILFFSRPSGWGFGVGMLGLCMCGVVGHALLTPNTGDFSGIVRLSQLAAFPMLPNLLSRLSQPDKDQVTVSDAQAAKPVNSRPTLLKSLAGPTSPAETVAPATKRPVIPGERRRYSSDPRTLRAFLQLKEEEQPEQASLAVARAIGHTMFADLTFVVTGPEAGQLILHNGYDLIREDQISGALLPQNSAPLLASALQRGNWLRITAADPQPVELQAVSRAVGMKEPGTLMFVPLLVAGQPWGGLLLLSPYSNRQWSQEDEAYLTPECPHIAMILWNAQNRVQGQFATSSDLAVEPADRRELLEEIDQLRTANYNLANGLEEARNELEEVRQKQRPAQISLELDALVALQKESQEIITALQSENEQLQAALGARSVLPNEPSRLESDLRDTLKELAHLQNQLAEANARILMFERHTAVGVATGLNAQQNQELLVSLVQDLRQPTASITGYTDLLLSESAGILGGLQHKFLERVRASSERMRSMLDDLIQLVTTGKSIANHLPQPVEIGTVIDSAMLETSAQLREKNITMRVDLPRDVPEIHADRDAVQQIIVHLLQNAGAVTPQEGTITLRVRVRHEVDDRYLLLQVVDTGGGIQPENFSRVFSPRYRADNPLIQGLGDTGIGLSIAKALVDAHGGRIWVESETGQTTTFSVLLPMHDQPVEKKAE